MAVDNPSVPREKLNSFIGSIFTGAVAKHKAKKPIRIRKGVRVMVREAY